MPKALTVDEKVADQIKSLRDDDEKKWAEISEIVDLPTGKAMLWYSVASVPKSKRIKNATADDVVRLRDDENLSWGDISARCMLSESTCRTMYKDKTGTDSRGLRIGKGGRPLKEASDLNGTGGKATKGKKSSGKTAPAAKDPWEGVEQTEEAITKRLTNYSVMYDGERVDVAKVKKVNLEKQTLLVTDTDGKSRTLRMAKVSQISKKKTSTPS